MVKQQTNIVMSINHVRSKTGSSGWSNGRQTGSSFLFHT